METEGTKLVRSLIRTLDAPTLEQVFTQLLGASLASAGVQPMRGIRSRQFREALGCSTGTWHNLRAAGKIPPGRRISPQLEIWEPEQVVATKLALDAEQRALDGQRQLAPSRG